MSRRRLRVGMIGYGFMGRAHSHAWRTAPRAFDLELEPELAAICGRDAAAAARAAGQFGWQESTTDWRELIAREDIDAIDVCAPGALHAEIAIAALEAGKHVLCEKPLANTVAEAEAMAAAAVAAASRGVRAMTVFNYRRVPAVALARELVRAGRLGRLHHVRAVYLQDWLVQPDQPFSWRLDAAEAGSGALGDLGSHVVDLVQHVTGDELASVAGMLDTFVAERPRPGDGDLRAVTVDDAAAFLGHFHGGAVGVFEATRFAAGRKNALRLELNGSEGSLAFDLERLNELELYVAGDAEAEHGFRRVLVTEPTHPWLEGWWPPGHILGWEHTHVHQVRDFVEAIGAGRQPRPSFADGAQVQRVLDAVVRSAAAGGATVAVALHEGAAVSLDGRAGA